MARMRYPTDLSDTDWIAVESLVPSAKEGGRPCKWPRREIMDAILYMAHTGSSWRMLPHDYPPWHSVYHYFRLWTQAGIMEAVNSRLSSAGRRKLEAADIIANKPRVRQP